MAVTPLLKPIQNKKGILYTFQSALEDINITLANSENDVRFSKFALLRIPEFGTPDTLETDNKFQFLAQGESHLIEGLNSDQNINLAQSFQSYALNLEALMISKPSYNREDKLTISERVFWKWLKESGSVRFRDANLLEKNITALGSDKRFVEPYTATGTYNKVVQYVGDIDVVNSIKSNDNAYTEVYIHVPTNVGSTPHVLFKSVSDDNYGPGMTIANNPSDPLDIEYLSGRHFNETHPFGLNVKAYYDLDDASVTNTSTSSLTVVYSAGAWSGLGAINNAYYTDSASTYDTATDQFIKKVKGASTIDYCRSTLDGISLDFDLANYKLASENPEIKVFSQFNDYVANKDFQFNAILLYYDTFDPNNLDSNGNPIDIKTNLYGVLFLDKVEQSGLEFSIPFITKYRPDVLNKVNGNSFAFKANLKLDTSIENVLVEKSINDFSTFSMDLFTDVLTEFRKTQTALNDKILELTKLKTDVEGLKDLLLNTEDLNELKIRITNAESSLTQNSAIFNNTSTLTKMIENNQAKIDDIINGDTNITISYDADVIKPGDGISLNTKTTNRVKIDNLNQDYNISNTSIVNIFNDNTIELSKFSNYIRHEEDPTLSVPGGATILTEDLDIFINDGVNSWKKGQTIKLVFSDEFILDVNNVIIKTDALSTTGSIVYGVSIAIFNEDDFNSSSTDTTILNKPIFEIVCVDEKLLKFKVDKIR
tara:strand:+ start:805 stop:2937 length:2133 start_codon:yes stop_codon:yes gene_type:complete